VSSIAGKDSSDPTRTQLAKEYLTKIVQELDIVCGEVLVSPDPALSPRKGVW
jgi:hypothetical protein